MAEDEKVLTRYGKVLYEKNPSLTGEFKFGVSHSKTSKIDDAIVVSHTSGEIISTGSFAFIEDKLVDNEQFIKIFVDGVSQFGELSKPGTMIFGFVCNEISGLRGKDKDKVDLNYLLAKLWKNDLSKRTYERGMSELLEKGFLFRSLSSDAYYVNVRFIFNGSRIAVVKSYRREDSLSNKELK